jgi:hypothetical protein
LVTMQTSATTTSPQREPMSTVDMVVALLPLAFIVVMFFIFVRWLRAARARAEESLALSRAMVSELRAIRQTLQPRDKETPPGS